MTHVASESSGDRDAYYGEGDQPWHKYPKYIDCENRIDSFFHWPDKAKKCSSKLSEAGFLYTGVGQKVTCFSCGKLWTTNKSVKHRKNCDYWKEHALLDYYKKCDYLVSVKGTGFIANAWEEDQLHWKRNDEARKKREQRKAEREEKKWIAELAKREMGGTNSVFESGLEETPTNQHI